MVLKKCLVGNDWKGVLEPFGVLPGREGIYDTFHCLDKKWAQLESRRASQSRCWVSVGPFILFQILQLTNQSPEMKRM